MIYALASGVLFRAPKQWTAKSGKPFVAATLKVKDGESFLWVRVSAFSESAQAELMRLCEGDALSVQGHCKAEIYRPDGGEPKLSLSIVANLILAARQPPRPRASKAAREPDTRTRQLRTAGRWNGPSDGPDDPIPFGEPR